MGRMPESERFREFNLLSWETWEERDGLLVIHLTQCPSVEHAINLKLIIDALLSRKLYYHYAIDRTG